MAFFLSSLFKDLPIVFITADVENVILNLKGQSDATPELFQRFQLLLIRASEMSSRGRKERCIDVPVFCADG